MKRLFVEKFMGVLPSSDERIQEALEPFLYEFEVGVSHTVGKLYDFRYFFHIEGKVAVLKSEHYHGREWAFYCH